MQRFRNTILLITCIGLIGGCGKKNDIQSSPHAEILPGNDPNFTIIAHNDHGFASFNRKVVVFGIDIYAVAAVEDANLLHAANVMAQYLDNDEDGMVDNSQVLDHMLRNKAFLVMWKKESDLQLNPPNNRLGQDLGNDETHPDFVNNGRQGPFDATLEEVLHLINNAGHSFAYPATFGQTVDSELAQAMDIARGGKFLTIPKNYPTGAWYTYDDATCTYADCQTIEYLYWALTSMLGAQENRASEIAHEWKLPSKDAVAATDTTIFEILTRPEFVMPTVLPNGQYKR